MEIDSYTFGEIKIDGEVYKKDLIIFPDRIKEDWWRDKGHFLQVKDLDEILEEEIEILIVGTGAHDVMDVSGLVEEEFDRRGIKLMVEETNKACDLYNELKEEYKVVAALHLTC